MSSVSNAARRRILVACFLMSLFTFAATIKFNRHCSICSKPVKVKYALTLGVIGYLDAFDIIHKSCMADWNGNGDVLNFYSLDLLNSDSQKHSG